MGDISENRRRKRRRKRERAAGTCCTTRRHLWFWHRRCCHTHCHKQCERSHVADWPLKPTPACRLHRRCLRTRHIWVITPEDTGLWLSPYVYANACAGLLMGLGVCAALLPKNYRSTYISLPAPRYMHTKRIRNCASTVPHSRMHTHIHPDHPQFIGWRRAFSCAKRVSHQSDAWLQILASALMYFQRGDKVFWQHPSCRR